MIDLPDLILVQILQNITLEDLLKTVSPVCKRLHSIIHSKTKLWRYVSFEGELNLSIEDLRNLLSHAPVFWTFLLPFAHLRCSAPDIDLLLIQGLSASKSLYWLDLSDCQLSSLCFLKCLPELEILNISGCKNLIDPDFAAVQYCSKVNQLYCSFTAISSGSIINLCSVLDLNVLDICDIPLTLTEIESLMQHGYETLVSVHLTLDQTLEESVFRQYISKRYLDCSFSIFKRK